MSFSPGFTRLIEALALLPGVGPRTAQRMALHLLTRNRQGGLRLATELQQAMDSIGHCRQCRTLCETELCLLCQDLRRDVSQLCIVETPADILAIEQTHYRGYYFVLLGHLSPLDGIGPDDIGITELEARLKTEGLSEIILATHPTVEGETTAHYIANLVRQKGLKATRIAHGVPIGGEVGDIDSGTLTHAFSGRTAIVD